MDFIITRDGVVDQVQGVQHQPTIHGLVYEVVRVMQGSALFLEDHYERLLSSALIRGFGLEIEFSRFRQLILELCKINGKEYGNVKFILSESEGKSQWVFSFIPHHYPSADDYKKGVSTGLLLAERENPNAKVIQAKVGEMARKLMTDKQLYEVLLVDRNGRITEGSRSNVFFVKGNRFYTAPNSLVLGGVTRKKVLQCLHQLNFTVTEQAVSTAEMGTFEAVFLTGTSPGVLPVNSIDHVHFQTDNPSVGQLMTQYELMIKAYLAG